MDYSQFRRTEAIDTGPMADFKDQFNSTGIGKIAGMMGDAVQGGNQWDQANQMYDKDYQWPQGSMQDQLGGNSIGKWDQPNTPDDTGYGINSGLGPDDGSILSPGSNPNGMFGDDSGGDDGNDGYAEGGAIEDNDDTGRTIPKGAAQDPHTSGLSTALQTIDDVMQHGYRINGLTGQSQQMPDDASQGGAMAPAYASGGNVSPYPPPGFGSGGTFTQADMDWLKAQQTQAAGKAPVAPGYGGAPVPAGGPHAPVNYSSQPPTSASTPTTSFNVPTNGGVTPPEGSSSTGQTIGPAGGTPIDAGTYTGHKFDDGGAIPDSDEDNAPPPSDPNGGWQGGIPTMDNIRGAMSGTPSPAQPLVAPVKRIMNLIQGGGAMPIPQAQQLEHQSGESDPNLAKIKTASTLAQSHGPDAAWSYLQSLRKQYDLNKTNAAVKATQGNIPQSTIAATNAMHNVLDGTSVHFSPAQGGVRVQVKRLGPSTPKPSQGFDDGGPVDDANGNDAQPAIPETANGADVQKALSGIGSTLADTVMSIPQYIQLLRGRASQYDEVWNKGIASALKATGPIPNPVGGDEQQLGPNFMGSLNTGGASPANAGPGGPTRSISQVAKDAYNSAGGSYEAGMAGGSPTSDANASIGQSSEQPMPQARPKGPKIGSEEEPEVTPPQGAGGVASTPEGNETGYEKMVRLYGKEATDRAQAEYPWASQHAQMMQSLQEQAGEETKHQNKLEENESIWGHKEKIANIIGSNRLTIQDMKDKLGDRTQAAMTARAIQIADMKVNAGRQSDISKRINAFVASGQVNKIPPDLLEAGRRMVNRAIDSEGAEARGPVQLNLHGNPNEGTQQHQVVIVNNKPYYADAGGNILGPAK